MSGPTIATALLENAISTKLGGEAPPSVTDLLKEYGMIEEDSSIIDEAPRALQWCRANKIPSISPKEMKYVISQLAVGSKFTKADFLAVGKVKMSAETVEEFMSSIVDETRMLAEEIYEKEIPQELESIADFELSVGNFERSLSVSTIKLNEEKITQTLNEFCENTSFEKGYGPGEIIVKYFEGTEVSVKGLVASGTKILDAILYVALKDDMDSSLIFSVTGITELGNIEAHNNLRDAKSALLAGICLVWNRGELPKQGEKREVTKFIRELIFQNSLSEEGQVAKLLSSGSPKKFPARVFLKVDLSKIPAEVKGRAMLSIAGNKVVRLANYSSHFQQATQREISKVSVDQAMKDKAYNEEISHAREIVETLKSFSTNATAQLNLHPLNENRNVPSGFVISMIKCVLVSLSNEGRHSMARKITEGKMGVFAKDTNIVGELRVDGTKVFNLITNEDYSVKAYNIAAVKNVFGEHSNKK